MRHPGAIEGLYITGEFSRQVSNFPAKWIIKLGPLKYNIMKRQFWAVVLIPLDPLKPNKLEDCIIELFHGRIY